MSTLYDTETRTQHRPDTDGYRRTRELHDLVIHLENEGIPADDQGRRQLLSMLNVASALIVGRTRGPDLALAARITELRSRLIRD